MRNDAGARRAGTAALLVVLALLTGGLGVALAVSAQADGTRKAYQLHTQGRYAVELAQSALEECLADFGRTLSARMGPGEQRTALLSRLRAGGGEVSGAEVLGFDAVSYQPERTAALVAGERLPFELAAVVIRPLSYTMVPNRGQVELTAEVRFRGPGARIVTRRVIALHHMLMEAPRGERFRVHPTAIQVRVDRGED